MPLSDSYKKHGQSAVAYNPLNVIEAVRAATDVLQRHGERHVVLLAVAGVIVLAQSKVSGDTIENTIELMRMFIHNLQTNPKFRGVV